MTDVGFIGLGNQGEPIAHRIREGGFPLRVWARRAATLEPFAGTSTVIADSPRALGAACEVVGVCVNFDDDVLQVVLGDGDDGVLAGMRAGGVVAIHSTVAPATVTRLEAEARTRGITLLDAPVSGARQGAIDGTMSVIVGGDAGALERVRPVFETFARTITLVGAAGAGQLTKMLNNNLCFANVALAIAALEIGADLGLDPECTADVIAASSGNSFAFGLVRHEPTMRLMAEPQNMRSNVVHFAAALLEGGIDDRGLLALSSDAKRRVQALVNTMELAGG
jgi:3-hydroxyisobutyrate dehydrogenase